jgi:hypothetical protein
MEGGLFNNLWDYIVMQDDNNLNSDNKYRNSDPSDGKYFNFNGRDKKSGHIFHKKLQIFSKPVD